MKLRKMNRWVMVWMIGMIWLAACASTPTKPTVSIVLTTSGTVIENQDVIVNVTASDTKGIVRLELTADSTIVATTNLNPSQKLVGMPMTWKATSGQHTLIARALNVDSVLSDPANLILNVATAPKPTALPTAAPLPTLAPVPTNAPAPTQPAPPTAVPVPPTAVPCTNALTFIADVTVPDGTAWAMNQGFNKIWRVRNDGSCVWTPSYQFVFVGGTQMSGVRQIAVPNTNPGATADLLVTMVAPGVPGSYSGTWQMYAPNGAVFGPQLHVSISVVNPNPPPQPTAVPQPVARRNISGQWITGEWSVSLTEAFGCASTACPINGQLIHGIFPTPDMWDVTGTINVSTGAVSFYPTVPGGPTFSGTVSADSRALSGSLTTVGTLTFSKQ